MTTLPPTLPSFTLSPPHEAARAGVPQLWLASGQPLHRIGVPTCPLTPHVPRRRRTRGVVQAVQHTWHEARMHRWHVHAVLYTTRARIIKTGPHTTPTRAAGQGRVSFLDRKVYFRVGEPGWRRVRNLSLELTLMLSAFMLTTVTADQQAACAAVTCAAVASLLSRLRRAQRASDFNQDRVRVVTARACAHVCTVYELRSSSRIGPRPGLNKVTMVSLSPERRLIFQLV